MASNGVALMDPASTLRRELETPLFRLLERHIELIGLAGFPHEYHTLNQILIFQRKILRVQDFGLHLVWKKRPPLHFIKPLSSELFTKEARLVRPWDQLHVLERSWLYSFHRLIGSELDFDIAVSKEATLLPACFAEESLATGYGRWKAVVSGFPLEFRATEPPSRSRECYTMDLQGLDAWDGSFLHGRYWYGDLRMGRLNLIVNWAWLKRRALAVCLPPISVYTHKPRDDLDLWSNVTLTCLGFFPGSVHAVAVQMRYEAAAVDRGLLGCPQHFYRVRDPVSTLWTGFGRFVILAFAYLTTTLAAMQVALTDTNPQAYWFGQACRWFAYLTLAFIVAQVPLVPLYVLFAGSAKVGRWLSEKQ